MSMELPEDRFTLSVDFAHCSSARTNPDIGCDLFSGWENCLQQVDLFQTLRSYSAVGIFHCLDVCERCLHFDKQPKSRIKISLASQEISLFMV